MTVIEIPMIDTIVETGMMTVGGLESIDKAIDAGNIAGHLLTLTIHLEKDIETEIGIGPEDTITSLGDTDIRLEIDMTEIGDIETTKIIEIENISMIPEIAVETGMMIKIRRKM